VGGERYTSRRGSLIVCDRSVSGLRAKKMFSRLNPGGREREEATTGKKTEDGRRVVYHQY
jgi:hypothetical protein